MKMACQLQQLVIHTSELLSKTMTLNLMSLETIYVPGNKTSSATDYHIFFPWLMQKTAEYKTMAYKTMAMF